MSPGLTDADAARVASAISAARIESTSTRCAHAWGQREHWCAARRLRAHAEAAGLDVTRITAHSLRAVHAATAALVGVPLHRIAAQTRHKDIAVLVNRCIRPLEAPATTSSKDLGL